MSGLTDIDAITLSTSRLVHTDVISQGTGWRVILVAAMSNIAFKYALAASLGSREMSKRLGVLFAVATAAGLSMIAFWG